VLREAFLEVVVQGVPGEVYVPVADEGSASGAVMVSFIVMVSERPTPEARRPLAFR
jgi:hypothetical protein